MGGMERVGRRSKTEGIYVRYTDSLRCTAELTQRCKAVISQLKKSFDTIMFPVKVPGEEFSVPLFFSPLINFYWSIVA